MTILAYIALTLLAAALVLWRELRRAPLLPPGYDADGQPLDPTRRETTLDAEEPPAEPQEARR